MKKSVCAVILLIILSCLSITAFATDNAIETRSVVVMGVAGEAYFSTGGRAEFPAKSGVTLRAGFSVRTGGDGEVYLMIDDDKLLKLAPNSALFISQADTKLVLTVNAGELVFNVTQKQPEGSVEFLSGGVSMGLRGTSGYLKRIKDALESAVECGLFDGEVSLMAEKLILIIEALEVDSIPTKDASELTPDNGSLFALLSALDEQLQIDLPPDYMSDEEVMLLARLWEEALALENAPDEGGSRRYLSDAEIVMLAQTAIDALEYEPQPYTSTEDSLKAYINELLAPIAEEYAVATQINTIELTPCSNGTANLPNGKTGGYEFNVTVTRNAAADDSAPRTIEITPNKYSGTPNTTRLKQYKAAVENLEIAPLEQANAVDEASIQAYIIDNIARALNDNQVKIALNCVLVNPIPGDADTPEGVNGSYTYTVTLTRGWYSTTTGEKVLIINAAPYSGVSNAEYLAQALGALTGIEDEFALSYDTRDIEAARDMVYSILSDVFGVFEDIEYEIVEDETERFTAAQLGTESAPDGVEGAYEFTLLLQKGTTAVTSDVISLRVIAKTYIEDENERILNEYIDFINNREFGRLNKHDAPDEAAVRAYINHMTIEFFRIEMRDEMIGGDIYLSLITAPVPGDADNPEGTPGEYAFSIALTRMGAYAYSDTRSLSIIDPYTDASNAELLDMYAEAVSGMSIAPIAQADAQAEADIQTYIRNRIFVYLDEDAELSISLSGGAWTQAVAGGADDPDGSDGAYVCNVTLARGAHSEYVEGVSVIITPTPYEGESNAEILAGYKNQLEGASFISPIPQADVTSEDDIKNHLVSEISMYLSEELRDLEVVVSASAAPGTLTPATEGDDETPLGTDGAYTCVIILKRGNSSIELNKTIAITATPALFVGVVQDILHAIETASPKTISWLMANEADDAKAYAASWANGIAGGMAGDYLYESTLNVINSSVIPTAFQAATEDTDGLYYFCVEYGIRGYSETIDPLLLIITATPETPPTDAELLEAYIARVRNMQIPPMPQANSNDAANKAHIISAVEAELNDNQLSVVINGYGMGYGPVSGGMEDPFGTNGRYGYTVTLTRGDASADVSVSIVITATPLHEDGMLALKFAESISDINIATIYVEDDNPLIRQLEASVSIIEDIYPDDYPGTTYEIVPVTEIPEGATELTFEFYVAFTKGGYTANSNVISAQIVLP